ncbi:MAG: LegC family aminotransferase [Rhodothermales bacterium]|nr:LegC family aminotransferase [Rhodothermales bacterium]
MIPLSVPHIGGNEWQYVKDCLDTGWISSAGSYVARFEDAIAEYTGARYGVACMNGTSALHLCLRILGVKRDDYVILPNITFVASANAVSYTGASPILIDADPRTWQMDVDLLEEFLHDRTHQATDGTCILTSDGHAIRAIMPVHVLGNMVDMDRLVQVAERYGLTIVEDATEALGSRLRRTHAGTFGQFGCFSFNGNKIISTGGGGMIVTDDEALASRAKHLSTQAKVSVDDYIHDETGYNYRLVNVLAAIGVAQMEQFPEFLERKKAMDSFYRTSLAGVGDIKFQTVAPDVDANSWLFTFATDHMRPLLQFLNERGVQSRPFWMPMNQLPMYKNAVYVSQSDHSADIYKQCVSIPSSVGLTDKDMALVSETIRDFYKNISEST